jgi:lysophospholipase L1-like esterase
MIRYCLAVTLAFVLILPSRSRSADDIAFPFKAGDRVSWIGSSSTNIGVWPRTMEFLLRTRHPELKLSFKRHSTGGGTFATGLQNLDKWLADSKPTLVFMNYGSNDATAGDKGLAKFKENIEKCIAKVKAADARVVLLTPQAADVRKSGALPAQRRQMYAEAMLEFAKDKTWPPLVDVFHPLDDLQKSGQKDDDAYTILKDTIHLTNPAYIGWGYLLYERLSPAVVASSVSLTAAGKVNSTKNCRVEDIKASDGMLTFTRLDEVLPLLPPGPLPPRRHVPLEKWSNYALQVTGLPDGLYEIRCLGKRLGTASAANLAQGVNLNTLLLDSKEAAPWDAITAQLWDANGLDQIGKTRWEFEVKRMAGN